MSLLQFMIAIFTAGLLSWVLSRCFLSFALTHGIMDIPNERSSHTVPTPRAGGVSFFVIFTSATFLLLALHSISLRDALALACGIPVAAIGFWDDRASLSPAIRIVVHLAAAVLAVCCLGEITPIRVGFAIYLLPITVAVFAVCGLVWLTNLTNFMDGIDGLAGVEVITTAGACSLLIIHRSGINGLAILFGVLATAVTGFLILNWSPAKIYMGDVGSGFLGFTLGVLAGIAIVQHQLPLWPPLILFGVFAIDATWTLLWRMLRGERWYAPHRTHGYQHAATYWGHEKTTLSIALINLLWLAPWAVLADIWPSRGPLLLACAWLPLMGIAYLLKAGEVLSHRKQIQSQLSLEPEAASSFHQVPNSLIHGINNYGQ